MDTHQPPIAHDEQGSPRQKKKLEDRLWIDSTLSRFEEIIRMHHDQTVEEFCDSLLFETCQTVNAISGTFYIVNEQNQLITATAVFGDNLDNLQKKDFQYSEGIIGQVARSRKKRYMASIPARSILISSSQGHINACSLLCSPLSFNGRLQGIVELVGLKPLEERELDFIERLSKSLASTLQGIQNNVKTKDLLRQLQIEAEQRSAHEEELKQNMEELEATQDEIERQRQELENYRDRLQHQLHQKKQELEEEQQKLSRLSEAIPLGLFQWEQDFQTNSSQFRYISEQCARLLGTAVEKLAKKGGFIIYQDDVALFNRKSKQAARESKPLKITLRMNQGTHSDWFRIEAEPETVGTEVVLWSGFVRKVNKRKK